MPRIWAIRPYTQRALDLPGIPGQAGIDGRLYASPVTARPQAEPSAPAGGASRSLGTNTEFVATPESLGNQEELPLPPGPWDRQRAFWEIAPYESRQSKCHRTRRTRGEVIARRRESGSHRFEGLVKCGSPWCPVCAQGRARKVALELGACIDAHRSESPYHDVWLAVLTWPHPPALSIEERNRLGFDAWRRLMQSRPWKRLTERYGIIGAPRLYETSIGKSGLHPHFNVVLFVRSASIGMQPIRGLTAHERSVVLSEIRDEFLAAWERACIAAGALSGDKIEHFREHGLHLAGGEKAAEYCAKWGLADEASNSAIKDNNQFTLLDRYLDGDRRAAAMYREFLRVMKGRQVVTGIKKLKRDLGVTGYDVTAHAESVREMRARKLRADGKEPPKPSVPYAVVIRRRLYETALKVGWAEILAVTDAAADAGRDPQRTIDDLLTDRRARAGPPGRCDSS